MAERSSVDYRFLPRPTMDWDKLRVFHAVAEAGSFTHAGETLNLSQSAVSRQISALEESLKVALFHRHARGLILTEQGDLLFQTAREVFYKLSMTESMLSETKERPSGPLSVTTTVAFGSTWLTPRLAGFREQYPEITVNLVLSDDELDLGMREADVAIRMSPPKQPDLVQRHLITLYSHAFASQAYLERHGRPQTVEDLDRHPLIVYGDRGRPPVPNINWLTEVGLNGGQRRVPILTVNNMYGIYRAIRAGVGIGSLPDYMVPNDRPLVRVLPELVGTVVEAYFVYPEELRHSKRITVFRDFLVRMVAAARF
jgi:DNA-binding transcriptional LysR family regulator